MRSRHSCANDGAQPWLRQDQSNASAVRRVGRPADWRHLAVRFLPSRIANRGPGGASTWRLSCYRSRQGFRFKPSFQVRLQKTFRHLLDARVVVPPQPDRSRQVKFQFAVCDRRVISFANIIEQQRVSLNSAYTPPHIVPSRVERSRNRESHRIPYALLWRPTATAGIPQVAECFQNILRGEFAFVAGSRAVTTPSVAERQPRRMRPAAILHSRYRHE